MERASSYLALMPLSKNEIISFTKKMKSEILSGETELYNVAIQLRAMEEVITTLRKDKEIQDYIIDKLQKNGSKYITDGVELSVRSVKSYKFDDLKLSEMKAEMDVLKEKIKARETFLKSITEPVADVDTGVVIEPQIYESNTNLVVSFKKL